VELFRKWDRLYIQAILGPFYTLYPETFSNQMALLYVVIPFILSIASFGFDIPSLWSVAIQPKHFSFGAVCNLSCFYKKSGVVRH
jgi:hypothetical protein